MYAVETSVTKLRGGLCLPPCHSLSPVPILPGAQGKTLPLAREHMHIPTCQEKLAAYRAAWASQRYFIQNNELDIFLLRLVLESIKCYKPEN